MKALPNPAATVYPVLRGVLMIWGAIAMLGSLALGGYMAWQIGPANREKIDRAGVRDVSHVLDWVQLGGARIERILHSYESPRSPAGNHVDVFALRLKYLTTEELSRPATAAAIRWQNGDSLPPLTQQALEFLRTKVNSETLPWFPSLDEMRSAGFHIYPWRIESRGDKILSAQLVLARPADRTLYYFDSR